MTAPFPPRIVPPAKITDYLMNSTHEEGGPKEAAFSRFGFSASDVAVITASLMAHPTFTRSRQRLEIGTAPR